MNYITQLTEASRRFYHDERLKPSHISLYIAIFQMANAHRFPKELRLARNELMQLSKIKSPVTYYKCLKELRQWKYISYQASKSPLESSSINIIPFKPKKNNSKEMENSVENDASVHDQLPVQNLTKSTSKNDQLVEPYINIYKYYINNREGYEKRRAIIFLEIQDFFKKNFTEKFQKTFSPDEIQEEAEKFFNYFEANHWKMKGRSPINDYRPVAKNWMLRAKEFKAQNPKQSKTSTDLKIHELKRNKNYNEPL